MTGATGDATGLAGRERIREVPTQNATEAGITTANNIATR
jgi:hypothetical protein